MSISISSVAAVLIVDDVVLVDEEVSGIGGKDVRLVRRSTSDLPVILCSVRYDSNAWRLKAAAAAELAGISAACCRLVTMVLCSESTTAAAAAKSPG